MNRILELQAQRNASGRGAWQWMSGHRRRVTSILLREADADAKKTLCLLGCGNCNDIDLRSLAEVYGRVDLADIDADAIRFGIQHQLPDAPTHVHSLAPFDVTGCAQSLSELVSSAPVTDSDAEALMGQLSRKVEPPLGSPCDVVASVGLLSQLIECITLTLGERHPQYLPAIQAIRSQHMRLMIDSLRPGGTGLLITDFVSTATAPSLSLITDRMLPQVVEQLIRDQNFFTGLNPNVLLDQLHHDDALAPRIRDLGRSDPWIWDMGKKQFAVVALRFRRR